ncbi:tail completion or Neck1 protein [Natrialba phage PhiCh1]|uniref:Virus protein phiCh1-VP16 n=2 Tax=root TaxID=1 RepID=D3T2G4_NATMM|nr:phage virion morphogenesis protein [Natrialba magadii]NP_665934.1 tail completion or Neck1 protein [Natrialba phage PhiCh1]YP_010078046.1 tail completion or Neck1 protein [Natrialba phage PhiCh1]AAM88690.1 unknown [Natrialba phage PhiCh1]ADD07773.1 virus protein phiCh1-VP16 [Natrialba magadii ATCC 43099]ELY23020.1 hypothetical protein C500_21190 [Natrialba magadii ATCC 43099]QBJ01197.1 putative neck protein, type 1 [Natrialba phage PhiCh1]
MVEDENNIPEAREAIQDGLTDGLERLHTITLRELITNMSDGQDALGNPWEPLKESTIRAKGSDTPLIDNSRLLTDINAASMMDRANRMAVIGTNLDYAEHHEFGAPEAGIPARPIFGPAGAYASQQAPDVIGDEIDTNLEGAVID